MSDWSLTDAYGEQKSEIISLELESRLYEHLLQDSEFTSQIQGLRKETFHRLGVYLPSIRIRNLSSMDPGSYMIRVRGRRIAEGVLKPPLRFSDQRRGEGDTPALHPLQRTEGWWTEEDGETCAEIIIHHVRSALNRRPEDLVTFDWVTRWLKQAQSHNPDLVKELESRRLTPGLLWSVMKLLAKERIPFSPFEELLEIILEYYLTHPHEGYTPPEWHQPHPAEIAKYVASKNKDRRRRTAKQEGKVIGFSK
ncbi:hypothetical protein GCM10007416_21170 [Kroppenstedtia guangzhouensis]|uniref:FHIPEP family protein n=1 Tax=Kroppenstedtia guangzhouensis TaxID=1274356 RepID=A0ABQ1GQ34_9BACL|nr:FHIPEP family type III secretion protein [Kroppenstedtia guangzhouensis]GGA47776.1 hypothetical protein GCM10007416_21170 [Kroppenstedtia guangzhouensis]